LGEGTEILVGVEGARGAVPKKLGLDGEPDGASRGATLRVDVGEVVGDDTEKTGADNTVHPNPIERWGKEAERRTWPWREYLPKVSEKRSRHWW